MKLKHLLLPFLFVCVLAQANAQNLYMPREIKKAFQKGTRSLDGRPVRLSDGRLRKYFESLTYSITAVR